MNGKEKLSRLFKIYSSNLKINFPDSDLDGKFVCPICFRIFPENAIDSSDVTIEHIIPEKIRKSFLTITCRECNNLGGTILDSHLVRRLFVEDKLAGEDDSPLRGEFGVGLDFITADLYLSTKNTPNIKIVGIPELNNPDAIKKVEEGIRSGVQSFQIKGKLGYRDLPSRISILKSAYLMSFSYFGYGYIKYPFLNAIRKQIMNSLEETDVLKGIVYLNHLPTQKSCLTVLVTPENLRCFFVILDLSTKINRYVGVVLPGFYRENSEIYQNWANVNYSHETMKTSVVKPIPYNEKFLVDAEYKNYALAVWKTIQESS